MKYLGHLYDEFYLKFTAVVLVVLHGVIMSQVAKIPQGEWLNAAIQSLGVGGGILIFLLGIGRGLKWVLKHALWEKDNPELRLIAFLRREHTLPEKIESIKVQLDEDLVRFSTEESYWAYEEFIDHLPEQAYLWWLFNSSQYSDSGHVRYARIYL